MRFKTKIAVVVFSTLIAFYAIVGSFMSKSSQVVARGSQYGQISIFDEVLSHIIRDYVEQPDLEKVRIGSLRGLAEGLDPYSAYLTPEQVKQYDPKANHAETGLVVSKVGGYAYVVAVLKGSPADQLGIRGGDFIEYVGKVPSRDLSLYDVAQLVNGQAGTVTVKVSPVAPGAGNPTGTVSLDVDGEQQVLTLVNGKATVPLAGFGVLVGVYTTLLSGLLALAHRNRTVPEALPLRDISLIGVATFRLSRLVTSETVVAYLNWIARKAATLPTELSVASRSVKRHRSEST